MAWLAAYWLCATVSVPCHILLSPAMEAGFLDRKLDPKRFQEYCLSREVAQDPTELWSSEDGTAAAGADEFSPSNRLLPISTRGVDVHLLAVRATGCVHIKDGTNFCVSQCDKESGLAKFETGWDYSSALHDTELLLGYISGGLSGANTECGACPRPALRVARRQQLAGHFQPHKLGARTSG